MTDEGCPIQAEATDSHIHKLIVGYSNYKQLCNSGAPDSLQIQALEQCGGLQLCPDFLVAMEPVYNQMVEKSREEEVERQKQKKAYNEKVNAAKAKAGRKR